MFEGKRSWQRLVEENVDLLDEVGMHAVALDAATWWWVSVTYSNSASAMRFVRDLELNGCSVELGRLVKGQVPPHPIWLTGGPINWIGLDVVLEVRDPQLLEQARRLRGSEKEELAEQLRFWTYALRKAVSDFLDGDLLCIDEGAAVLRRRLENEPETLTVLLPDDTSEAEMSEAIEEAQATVAPEVRVVGQRYQREKRGNRSWRSWFR